MTKYTKPFYVKYKSHEDCIALIEQARWDKEPSCPYCESTYITPIKSEGRYHCNNCNTSFSVTVGTPFHKTKADLQKWFAAIQYVASGRNDLTVRALGESLGVTKDTASFMVARIKKEISENTPLIKKLIAVI